MNRVRRAVIGYLSGEGGESAPARDGSSREDQPSPKGLSYLKKKKWLSPARRLAYPRSGLSSTISYAVCGIRSVKPDSVLCRMAFDLLRFFGGEPLRDAAYNWCALTGSQSLF